MIPKLRLAFKLTSSCNALAGMFAALTRSTYKHSLASPSASSRSTLATALPTTCCRNGKACGVIEAKEVGVPLKGVELQSARYAQGLPTALPKRPSGRPGMPARFFLPSTPYTHSSSLAMSSSCSTFMGIREVEAQIDPNLQRA